MNTADANLIALPASIGQTAADWVARRQAGLTDAEDAALDQWLAADPRHAAAFREMEAAWAMVNAPRLAGHAAQVRARLAAQAIQRRRRVRTGIFVATGLAAAAVLALMISPAGKPSASPAAVPTVVVRPDLQALPDGSKIELNAGAEVAIEFTPERRGVRLLRGEALFTVAKDPSRPFVVTAGAVSVKAIGTAFSVRFDPKQVDVLVTEGRVTVEHAHVVQAVTATTEPIFAKPIFLEAGGKIALPTELPAAPAPLAAPAITPVTPAEIAVALAWRGRRIEFTETTLGEAVRLFNDQNAVRLSLATPALAQRRIGGIYWSDDPEGFARLVESSLGLKVTRVGDEIVLRAGP
jgi:transmembrane sensor